MARKRHNHLDGIDAEQVQRTTQSRGWQLITERLNKTLAGMVTDLERPHSEVDTATIRGTIAGLRLALGVPKILMVEGNTKREVDNG